MRKLASSYEKNHNVKKSSSFRMMSSLPKIAGVIQKPLEQFYKDQNQWILWVPVLLGCGIVFYYSGASLFDWRMISAVLSILLILCRYTYKRHSPFLFMILAFLFITLGFCTAKLEHHLYKHAVLTTPLKDISLTAQVASVEELPTSYRFILTNITTTPFHQLEKIRLTVAAKYLRQAIKSGDHIQTIVTLMPLPKPLSPGMYDFRQTAHFQSLSAVGRAKSSIVLLHSPPPGDFTFKLQNLRDHLNTYFKQSIPGEAGKIAAALITGDRSGLDHIVRQNFSDAGIAHILAISGLHMAIVAGFIFFLIRGFLSLIPKIALRYDTKKIAALLTICATSFYVLLCWSSISARRAYFMILFVMFAIFLNRKPLSLRTLSFAAIFILLFTPHSLLSPSFQLSFAAVTALIAAYEYLNRPILNWKLQGGFFQKLSIYFLSVFGTTLLATFATAPFTLYIFQSFSLHSLWTNLIAIPLASFMIMPLEILSVLTMPFSINHTIASLLETSLNFLIYISYLSSQMTWGIIHLPKPSLSFMVSMTLGGLWICLWRQSWRWLGVLPLLIGIWGFIDAVPPTLFISHDARTFAIRQNNILWINSPNLDSYAAQMWSKYAGHLTVRPLKEASFLQKEGYYLFSKSNGTKLILIPPFYKGKLPHPHSKKIKILNLSRRSVCPALCDQEITKRDIRQKEGLLMGKISIRDTDFSLE